MRELGKLRALTAGERRLLAEMLLATPFVASGIALTGFRRTQRLMALWPAGRVVRLAGQAEAFERAEAVARIAGIATGRGPVRATCLRRALLVWWRLRREGIATALRVGVRPDGRTLHAHAWVELMGRPVGDDADVADRFPAFDRNFVAP